MKIYDLHDWEVSPQKAVAIQKGLRPWVVTDDQYHSIKRITRVMICDLEDRIHVQCITMSIKGQVLEEKSGEQKAHFLKKQGLTSFRIAPVILRIMGQLTLDSDLIICDGRGVTIDDGFGVATHIGLLTNKPCIGLKFAQPSERILEQISRPKHYFIDEQHTAFLNLEAELDIVRVSAAHRLSIQSALELLQGWYASLNGPLKERCCQQNVELVT